MVKPRTHRTHVGKADKAVRLGDMFIIGQLTGKWSKLHGRIARTKKTMSKVMCRMWFDLERVPSVPKELFRKLIMYPAVDLDVKGHMTEVSPDSYHVEAEAEHGNLNDYITYVNGVTRVIAVLRPGERECDVKPEFTREFEVKYLVPLPPSTESLSLEVNRTASELTASEEVNAGSDIMSRETKASQPEEDIEGKRKGTRDRAMISSDDEASLTMEPVHLGRLRETQAQKNLERKIKDTSTLAVTDADELDSQCMDWPETDLYEESCSLLSKRNRRK